MGEVTVIMAAKPPLAIMMRRNETRMPVRIEAVKYLARPEEMITKRTCLQVGSSCIRSCKVQMEKKREGQRL